MDRRIAASLVAFALVLGMAARDAFTTRVRAGADDAWRREDVEALLRVQEAQVRALQEQTRALEVQAKATQDLARGVRDAGRSCK